MSSTRTGRPPASVAVWWPPAGLLRAALGADDAVDEGHADAGEVAGLRAVGAVLAGGTLCDRCNNYGNPAK